MRAWWSIVGVALAGLGLVVALAIGSLVGLNAECTGSTLDCPRSDAYRATLVALPVLSAVVLAAGGVWGMVRRRFWPVGYAFATVLVIVAVADAALDGLGVTTLVLLAAAAVLARASRPGSRWGRE